MQREALGPEVPIHVSLKTVDFTHGSITGNAVRYFHLPLHFLNKFTRLFIGLQLLAQNIFPVLTWDTTARRWPPIKPLGATHSRLRDCYGFSYHFTHTRSGSSRFIFS